MVMKLSDRNVQGDKRDKIREIIVPREVPLPNDFLHMADSEYFIFDFGAFCRSRLLCSAWWQFAESSFDGNVESSSCISSRTLGLEASSLISSWGNWDPSFAESSNVGDTDLLTETSCGYNGTSESKFGEHIALTWQPVPSGIALTLSSNAE